MVSLRILSLVLSYVVFPAWHVDGRMRSTPFGPRPERCVMTAPNGAVIKEHTHDSFMVHAPGGDMYTVVVPPECHEFEAARLRTLEAQKHKAKKHLDGAMPDGWADNAGVYYMPDKPTSVMSKFTGTWQVPPSPVSPKQPETQYWFIGLEDRTQGSLTSIHQPVLTWGDETEGGSGGWHLWSWTCCPKNVTWHSEDITGFGPGDTIRGSIEKVADATWQIDSSFQDPNGAWKNTTLVSQVGNFVFNYADVTFEVYNVTNCNQLSPGPVTFSELNITLSDGTTWTPPTWYFDPAGDTCQGSVKEINPTTILITHA